MADETKPDPVPPNPAPPAEPTVTPGLYTTEFWIHLFAQLLAAAVAIGLLTSDKADVIFKGVGAGITAVMSILGAVMYSQNRTTLKRGQ